MRPSRRLPIPLLLLAAAAWPLFASDTYTIDKTHSDVSFQIRHFASKVRGRFTDFDGTIQADTSKPETSSVSFRIKTGSIDTGNADRDNHLRTPEFFDAAKYPEIRFESRKVRKAGKGWEAEGPLTLHGVTKDIKLPFTIQGRFDGPKPDEMLGIHAAFPFDRRQFGMAWADNPEAKVVGNKVTVEITLAVKRVAGVPPKPTPAKKKRS